MGNNLSVDHEQPDIWWPTPHAEAQPEQLLSTSQIIRFCTMPTKSEAQIAVQSTSIASSTNNSDTTEDVTNEAIDEIEDTETSRRTRREDKLQQFKSELEKKHFARREAIAERSREIIFLRDELAKHRQENEQLKEMLKQDNKVELVNMNLPNVSEEEKAELEKLKLENNELKSKINELTEELGKNDELTQQNSELRKSIAETQKDLQAINVQVLEFEKERQEYHGHVVALKDVIRVSKKLLQIRENQLQELKSKVSEIEASLAQREASMLSTNLRDEYERQLRNIRALRTLYEQRQAAAKAERDLLTSELSDAKNILEVEQKKNSEFQERIDELENNVSAKYDEIKTLESQLGLAKAEYRGLKAEMSVINQLFSQILFGFHNCKEVNFDKLIKLLEENHDLLTDIVVNEESQEISSALPKVLLDLVNQVNEEKRKSESQAQNDVEEESVIFETSNVSNGSLLPTIPEENTSDQQINQMNSAEKIVTILPKVWRVLIELLRQQSGQQPVDINENGTDPCYKSVQTPKGPKLVLSVSQTFIRLKDLILEKKSLEKEMHRLKHLNTHLEVRLQDQEKRLETVSTELSKTWHVVGRMQRQHQQLHTHEKILRYELAQKRKMLTELKQELEYCREKWVQAREKNSNTEEEWKKLRTEFASRKATVTDDINNSAESGYSDERECSSDDDVSYSSDTRQIKLPSQSHVVQNGGDDRSEQTSETDDKDRTSRKSTNVEINENMMVEASCTSSQRSDIEVDENKMPVMSSDSGVTLHQNDEHKMVDISSDQDDICNTSNVEPQLNTSDVSETKNSDEGSSKQDDTSKEDLSSIIDNTNKDEKCSITENPNKYEEYGNINNTNQDETEVDKEFNSDLRQKTIVVNEEVPSSIELNIAIDATGVKTDFDVQNTTNDTKTDEVQNALGVEQYNALLTSSLEVENSLANKEIAPGESSPSSSSSSQNKSITTTQDEMLSRRDARLKRLEEQCQQLVNKVTNTTQRSTAICNRLETLHEQLTGDSANRGEDTEHNEDETNEVN